MNKPCLIVVMFFSLTTALFAQNQAARLTFRSTEGVAIPTVVAESAGDLSRVPLWDEDETSTGWILTIDQEDQTPAIDGWTRGEGSGEDSQRILWRKRSFAFVQDAIISVDMRHVRITARFENSSSSTVRVQPSLLVDTVLGEATGLPFLLEDGTYISSETRLSGSQIPLWLKSRRDVESPALTFLFTGEEGGTLPQEVIIANWLRLKEEGREFEVEAGRSFDALPLSENDSAVKLRFAPEAIPAGQSREWVVVLGLDERPFPGGFDRLEGDGGQAAVENARLRSYTLRQRLRDLDAVIDSIDELLDNEDAITTETVADIENRLDRQEQLRTEYENL
ncbi:MAG: hypothetical protein MI717_15070 [Spirochaetales bacterium]|nr:hypothetical protein [Spirochaetales bacterium]